MKNFNLKNFLKSLKTNESTISMALGALVIVIVGVLVVNYFKDRGKTLPGSATENGGLPKQHVVTRGESLWSISEDYYGSGYNWSDVAKANNLKNYSLEVGQTLDIPDVEALQPTSTKLTKVNVNSQEAIAGDSYTVVKGDSLWKISVRAYGDGYKWSQIAKANNLLNPNLIHSGNVLTLPR